jgi:hypothetical protein
MDVRYIEPHELRGLWEWVRTGLNIVRAKGHDDWIVEDIYCDCYEQRSMLWVGSVDGDDVGFMVLQPMGEALHVWVAYLSEGHLLEGFKHIKGIAALGQHTKITFSSVRKGWEVKARTMGFRPKTWELQL